MTTAQKLEHALEHLGFLWPDKVLAAAHTAGCPLSVACTILRNETANGANEFGHDPTTSIPRAWMGGRVTRLRYAYYKARRRRHGNQGVGPCQLTSPGLQDEADALGGCWKPTYNMTVGFRYVAGLEREFGSWQLAFQHYNGSGPAAVAYGQRAARLVGEFHQVFEDALR